MSVDDSRCLAVEQAGRASRCRPARGGAARSRAMAHSGSARMLARIRSYGPAPRSGGAAVAVAHQRTRTRAATPLLRGVVPRHRDRHAGRCRPRARAPASISRRRSPGCPSRSPGRARGRSGGAAPARSSASRQPRVDACSPEPNARPASSRIGTAPAGGASRTWLPCTQKRPIRCGVKLGGDARQPVGRWRAARS